MIARALITQSPIDQHEIGWRCDRHDLSGGCHADQKSAAGGKKLLRDEHGEGCADGAADDAKALTRMLEFVQVCVIAGPSLRTTSASGSDEYAHDIAVRIE